MKNDGFLNHQVSSFSPEHWTKVLLQECAVVGRVYHLPWRSSVVEYYPITAIRYNEHHLHSTLYMADFLWTRRTEMLPFDGVSCLVRMSEPRFRPQRRFVQENSHLPFATGPTRSVRLHSGAIVAPRKFQGVFNAMQVCGNPECRAECGAEFLC